MTFTHTIRRIAGVVPVAVALAVAAPAGARPFDINQASPVQSAPAVQSNPDQQVSRTGHLGATALFAPPVAKLHRGRPSTIHSLARGAHPTSLPSALTESQTGGSSHTEFAAQSPFDWGDAAIGAAGGIGICLLIGGGLVTVARRRDAQAGSPAAIVG
jgi:hypothetical protein